MREVRFFPIRLHHHHHHDDGMNEIQQLSGGTSINRFLFEIRQHSLSRFRGGRFERADRRYHQHCGPVLVVGSRVEKEIER